MNALYSFIAVLALILLVSLGVGVVHLDTLFGIIIPYLAIITFTAGVLYRVFKWAKSPVPFRIPTTCGQQKSLSFIKSDNLEAPANTAGVLGRMFLEIFFFRSLFRNTKTELKDGPKLVYGSSKFLWLGAIAFHYAFLAIFLRHYRFFAEPIPIFVSWIQTLDGFFQIGLPILYTTDLVILGALGFLLFRRLFDSKLRYISLPSDYFALFLLLGIAATGIIMRYFIKVDVVAAKTLALGLVSFHPVITGNIGIIFYMHLFLVSVLFLYFPFSKLMHMPGVFLSPTRNLANTNRTVRHINPWNPKVKVHTYEEWEDEHRDKIKIAGLPLERE